MLDRLSAIWSVWHPSLGSILGGVLFFLVSSVGGLFVAGLFVVNMPEDYFRGPKLPPPDRRGGLHGWAARMFKNILGIVVIVVGLILALPGVPGPGVLIMLIGLMLMDFPGKHRLERWMVMRPGVLPTMNKLRSRYGRPPMLLDEPKGE
jgi:hypothetical protein